MTRPMTDEQINREYRLHGCSKSYITVLADLNACTTNQIKKVLGLASKKERMAAISKPDGRGRSGRKPLPVDWEKVMSLYQEGLRDREIARQVGCSHHTIGRWRRDNDLGVNYKNEKVGFKVERVG